MLKTSIVFFWRILLDRNGWLLYSETLQANLWGTRHQIMYWWASKDIFEYGNHKATLVDPIPLKYTSMLNQSFSTQKFVIVVKQLYSLWKKKKCIALDKLKSKNSVEKIMKSKKNSGFELLPGIVLTTELI